MNIYKIARDSGQLLSDWLNANIYTEDPSTQPKKIGQWASQLRAAMLFLSSSLNQYKLWGAAVVSTKEDTAAPAFTHTCKMRKAKLTSYFEEEVVTHLLTLFYTSPRYPTGHRSGG